MKMSDDEDQPKSIQEQIEDFEFHESVKIHDFYDDLKSRFSYFLDDMQFHDLFNFIIDQRFYTQINQKTTKDFYFENEYCMEIQCTLSIISDFLRRQDPKIYKHLSKENRVTIRYQDWYEFCYNFTTIKAPTHYDNSDFELPEMSDDEFSD